MIIMFNLGVLVAYIVCPYFTISTMAWIFMTVSVLIVGCFCLMPDSPYFLTMVGRLEDAEAVLVKLRGKPQVSEELETIKDSLAEKKDDVSSSSSLKNLFTDKANFRGFVIIMLFITTHQFGGYFVIIVYGQLIFKELNSPISDHTANIAIGVVQLVSSVITTFLVDRLGRKPLILFSGVVVGLCNALIAGFFYFKDYTDIDITNYTLLPIVSAMLQVFAFNCGLLCLQPVLLSEIFSAEIKAMASCVTGVLGGIMGTFTCKLYLLVAVSWSYGHSMPFVVAALSVWLATFYLLAVMPETKGKTFVQIQKELRK